MGGFRQAKKTITYLFFLCSIIGMDHTESRQAPSPEPASDDAAPPLNPTAPAGADQPSPGRSLLRESEPPEETGRQRHDAFTGARKQQYLKALAKTGCILDACRTTGVSSSTVYNHQGSDPEFARHCQMAVDMASTPLELTAYERAVVGQEEPVVRGGKVVGTRMKRSDYMLKVLLQGANPRKYGARPGFTRKRMLKFERKQMEREIYAGISAAERSGKDAVESILAKIENIERHRDQKRRAQGWTALACGVWVPPGWAWAGKGDPNDAAAEDMKKIDAVCNSSNSSTSPDYSSLGFPGEE
jgi:hypothetical protein